jgi:hypothetical protein
MRERKQADHGAAWHRDQAGEGMSRDAANAGAVAFKGAIRTGEFSDAVVLKFGDVRFSKLPVSSKQHALLRRESLWAV